MLKLPIQGIFYVIFEVNIKQNLYAFVAGLSIK